MTTKENKATRISVRELADFVHRRGDLGGQGGFQRSNRALEGAKGHRRLQKSRGPEYEAEVSIDRSFGLPGMSIERDLLADYFNRRERNGFDYAYRLPGMQRVRQAVGRLIRSDEDFGYVLLIDKRYREQRTQALFPSWWNGRPPW